MANSDGEQISSASSSPPIGISRIGVKVPPFWKTNPKLWFRQIECQFFNAGIAQDETKYHTLVGSIETNILNTVSHIIENPPSSNKYEVLKTAMLAEFQDSEERRLQKLLENVEMGDRKPSAVLREMRQLSSGKVSDDMLKSLGFQRLPTMIKTVLSVSTDSLDKLAVMADKINDQLGNSSRIRVRGWMALKVRSKSRNRNSSQSRDTSERLCWYHFKFGSKASKCRPPCTYKTEN
ncbi:uncharacterized protein [Musca autumnalis]|uniref:uncharacterized protein n=1 Tax=Musca autumnalis TaxID=221902 RepID=UPI003CF26F42